MEGAPRPHRRSLGSDLLSCPFCGASDTITIEEIDVVAFLCEGCGEVWRIELGYVHRLPGRRAGSSPVSD
ncbi:MAG: hypothetical protein WB239_06835 [Acidimicrobiia bacterium]